MRPADTAAAPGPAPGVVSAHQGGQPGGRRHDPGDDQGQRQVPVGAGRAEQRGQAQFHRHRVHRGDVPVRQRPGDRHRLPGRHERGALQRRLDRLDRPPREPGQVRQRLVPDRAAVAVGAPQVRRLVVAAASLLVGVAAADPGHVHRRCLRCHDPVISVNSAGCSLNSRSSWLQDVGRRQSLTQVRAGISTESYGNFGL